MNALRVSQNIPRVTEVGKNSHSVGTGVISVRNLRSASSRHEAGYDLCLTITLSFLFVHSTFI